jgi:hypothetical protein
MSGFPTSLRLGAATLFGAAALRLAAQAPGPGDSPFAPPPGSAAAQAAAGGTAPSYELAGASATAEGTQVCVFDAQAKRSAWIAVGGNKDGIRVVSYDPDKDQAVVSVNGETQVLTMRKASVTAGPAVDPASFGPQTYASGQPPSPPPGVDVQLPTDPKARQTLREEREARMMVADLMEIGMQQRKAYAEAKRKAALKAAQGQ